MSSRSSAMSSPARCGWSRPAGSSSTMRAAPISSIRSAVSTSASCRLEPYSRPASNSRPAEVTASAATLQVVGVVQRVVQAERVDPARSGARHEAAHEIVADRPRPDEEAAAHREHERRRRPRPDRSDPLPRALDAPADGRVERPAAGDLEIGVSRTIEDLGQPQQLCGRHRPRERLLREHPDRGVDQSRHQRGTLARGLPPVNGPRFAGGTRCCLARYYALVGRRLTVAVQPEKAHPPCSRLERSIVTTHSSSEARLSDIGLVRPLTPSGSITTS